MLGLLLQAAPPCGRRITPSCLSGSFRVPGWRPFAHLVFFSAKLQVESEALVSAQAKAVGSLVQGQVPEPIRVQLLPVHFLADVEHCS